MAYHCSVGLVGCGVSLVSPQPQGRGIGEMGSSNSFIFFVLGLFPLQSCVGCV